MRLVFATENAPEARKLASFLFNKGIDNRLEINTGADWGSPDYGVSSSKIWIIDEDRLDSALNYVKQFQDNPNDPIFTSSTTSSEVQPEVLLHDTRGQAARKIKLGSLINEGRKSKDAKNQFSPPTNITMGFLALCCIIFMVCSLTAPTINNFPPSLSQIALSASQTEKEMLYDYPKAYELADKAVKLYGIERLQNPQDLPPEGQFLLTEAAKTPYFHGYYDILISKLQGDENTVPQAPMFEKIREGQVWRLFTPALLHGSIFHLGFNMLWLIVLGKQIEQRLSGRRYLFLILIIGIISNTAQYLMGGPNFLGFSGIVMGMLTFIWVRQKIAPWEGYPLEKATIIFVLCYILALLALQMLSFFLETRSITPITPGIANTAHLVGAAVGALLGCLSFFSWKTNKFTRPTK